MELIDLHGRLIDAFNAVDANKPALARMHPNGVIALLRPIRTDYSDVMNVYLNTECTIKMLRTKWHKPDTKSIILESIDAMINMVDAWINCRAWA